MTVLLYDSIYCRLCGEENTNGILLYENDTNSGVDICSMINNYLPIKVANDGNFPRTICPGCNLQLHSTVQFFDLLIEGQKKIRELWKEQLIREKRREKQQQQQSLLISKNRPQLIETTADIAELVSNQNQVTLDIQDSSAGFDLAAAILQASSDVNADDVSAANLQELDSLQLDQVLESGSGNIFVEDHGLVLRAAGLERPRKKRGRPRKQVVAKADSADEPLPLTTADDQLTEQDQLDDADGRRRRKRQIPLRFREAVQGMELERILKEEGVTDGEDENESIYRTDGGGEGVGGGEGDANVGDEDDPMKNRVNAVAPDREVIGHLETVDGQNMGELIIVNKKLANANANRLARWQNQKRRIRRRRKPRFFCEICGRTFIHIGKFRYHKSFHTGIRYECVECKKRFSAKENFELHQKMTGHTGEDILKEIEEGSKENLGGGAEVVGGKLECRKCDKTFSTKQNLENHTKVVHELEKPYKCEICDRRFGYQNSLRCHILTHQEGGGGDQTSQEGGGAFPCDICGRRLNHPSSVVYHKEAEHNDGRRFVCDRCGKAFKHKQLLHRHQLVHTDDRPHQCQTCQATFKTKANLLSHQSTHTGEKPHFCEICGQQFAYKTSLVLHYRWHSGGGAFPCDICGRRLNHPSSVVYHKEAEHNDGRRFVCDRCGKAFKHKQLLHRHQLVHTDDRPHQCQTCQATFKTKANLLSHQSTHTGEKPHFCEICGQQFAYKTSLVLHYRWHSGQKPYQCEVCKKAFSQKGNLQEHLRIHTGEKPYSCVYCDKKFTTSSQFKLHMKRHTGERPWKCDTCGKTFLHKDTWKCHQRRHANVKPYTCHLCPRQFSEHYAMKKHMRLHTGERPYQCNYCGKLFSDCSNLAKHRKAHEREVNSKGGGGGVVLTEEGGGEGLVLAEEGGGGGAVDQEVVEVGGGTIEFTGTENLWGVTTTQAADSDVQQIIYVTYQDPTDPSGKVCEKYLMPGVLAVGECVDGAEGVVEGGLAKDATTLQFTDEHGNPFHITLNDNNELQVGLDDGSVDGGGVVGAATLDSYQSAILEAKTSSNYIIKVSPDSLMNGDASKLDTTIEGDIPATYAFMIQNGSNKDQLESFSTSVQIPAEYLNIN
ncbi:zinc finger protein 264 [Nilaparvata lugens]|uniref:zinc finger protein 264 n=1 Tax=Nilaparvata lugens TaxID=108931 RepID=UPI00193DA019|nr:zinc finger protein 264 [Nilaparvata lugens]